VLALLIDLIAAALVARFVPAGWKQWLFALLGGWVAAVAGSVLVGLAFGWPLVEILSRLTVALMVHPLVVVGLVWAFNWIAARRAGRTARR
jgi:hypothetical protein